MWAWREPRRAEGGLSSPPSLFTQTEREATRAASKAEYLQAHPPSDDPELRAEMEAMRVEAEAEVSTLKRINKYV